MSSVKPGFSGPARTVWIRCFEVPLHGWESSTFRRIREELGEVVGVAKATSNKSFLEYGRICVRTHRHCFINEQMELAVFGDVFTLQIREELSSETSPWGWLEAEKMNPHRPGHLDLPVWASAGEEYVQFVSTSEASIACYEAISAQ